MAAEKTLFPRLWYGDMISANLEVIWEMSAKAVLRGVCYCWTVHLPANPSANVTMPNGEEVMRFQIEFSGTPFLETSATGTDCRRLNWRAEILLTRNQDAIEQKRILDLASHDGRFSFGALEMGAKYV